MTIENLEPIKGVHFNIEDIIVAKDKINELIDAVNDIKQAQIEHIKEFKGHRHLQWLTYPERDKLIKKLDYIELWINNHENNILPRLKSELLTALDDREFRIEFLDKLILTQPMRINYRRLHKCQK